METIVGYVSCCGVGIMFSLFNLQSYVTQPAIKNKELSFCAAFPLGMRPTSSNLDRTSLANKGFIKAKRYVFSGRINTGNPQQAEWLAILPAWAANQKTRFTLSCLLKD